MSCSSDDNTETLTDDVDASDDDVTVPPENQTLTEGFILVGTSADGNTVFANYVEELPTSTFDITSGKAFVRFIPRIINGLIITGRTDGSNGFEKLRLDGNANFVSEGIISTTAGSRFIAIRDSEFGVFQDENELDKIFAFNPTTLEVDTDNPIDVSANIPLYPTDALIQNAVFRGTNEIVLEPRASAGFPPIENYQLPIVDIAAANISGIAEFEDLNSTLPLASLGNNLFDETGNIYPWYFLRGGESAAGVSPPFFPSAILRLPNNSMDFDPSYRFEPAVVNNPELERVASFITSFTYHTNDTGFAVINLGFDADTRELIDAVGGIDNLGLAEIGGIFGAYLNPATAPSTFGFVELDLENEEVSVINGLPNTGLFEGGPVILQGEPYFIVRTKAENALYSYEAATQTAVKRFDVTGGSLTGIFDLSGR